MQDKIIVKGARANNLKNIDVTIPRDKLVVMTGLSGSGKSSLAFDTIYAEGQRRYVESLSSYARMFLGQMDKPDVDYIEGLSPAISIDQKTTSKTPRSTVGTVTEIYDYLRLLWARVGTPHCPKCGKEIRQQTIDQIIDQVLSLPEGTRIQVMAPVIRGKKGEHAKIFEDAKRSGYVRARVDGNLYELDEEIKLEKNKKHTIEIVVDRLIIRPDIQQRLTDSVETASGLTGGLVVVNLLREERDLTFSQNYACEDCGISIEELTPRMFSFNNPFGACPTCTGLGSQLKVDPELIVPDKSLSILEGAIQASGWNNIRGDGISRMYFDALAKKYHFSLTDPWETLPEDVRSIILYGTGGEKLELHYDQPRGKGVLYQPFEGICNNVERRYKETQSDASKRELEELMAELDGLCGLDKVKADVKSLINLVKVRRLRQEHGLPVPPMSLHLVFLGNPGTGKTTVARLLAKIYRAIGVLSKGQLVEVDRSGLVAGFVGQTALKTGEVIEKALGGVLFIDEAYALANQDAPNDFGREAIETLLKGMEDHRDDLIVIAAGYTELMGRFLHANPGLESRFNKYFYFEDYNGAQLLAIFQSMCAKNGYTLDDKATEYAESYFKTLYEERDENFGNARDVRNVFERAVARQSDRVAALEKPGKEELMALTVADLQEEGGPVPDGAPDETLPESP